VHSSSTDLEQSELAQPSKLTAIPVTVAAGDGIGPEITAAVMSILSAAGAHLDAEYVEVGEQVYLRGNTSGIPQETWDSIARTRVMLKGPITTPQGGGYKSLNVTMRKTLGLYANVRPCRTYKPIVATRHADMDVVIIRENEEDLYAGIEHRQTQDVAQCLKLITRSGSERIARYAFEYARQHGRSRITCMIKDNIMKLTDGLFHRVFDEVAREYPEIQAQSQIVDFGMANFVHRPEVYDVVLLPNLYGDILSDIAAQMTGSVGLGGSVNIGSGGAIFEAIHGSAPDLAADVANPSGLLLAAVEMLRHLRMDATAAKVMNAWLCTLEEGIHTVDIAGAHTKERAGTRRFTEAVIERLGRRPVQLAAVEEPTGRGKESLDAGVSSGPAAVVNTAVEKKTLVGVDVFVDEAGVLPDVLAAKLQAASTGEFTLKMITNRGVKVWPNGREETICTDHWRCRFEGANLKNANVADLLAKLAKAGIDFIKTEQLYNFNGKPGYSLGQGQ
jgi:isocitrate dehydrogenase